MLWHDGRTILSEWAEKIVDKFCEEKAINERTSFNNIKSRFHDEFHKIFLCTILTFLFKFLIDKGVAHIIEPSPPLVERYSNNSQECIKRWEFIMNQDSKKYIKEWSLSSTKNKSGRQWGGNVEPSSRNDCLKPLVDQSRKDSARS